MKDVQPIKDYILITQEAWHYFADKYKGIEIRRIANEKGEFDLKLISVKLIILCKALHNFLDSRENCLNSIVQYKSIGWLDRNIENA